MFTYTNYHVDAMKSSDASDDGDRLSTGTPHILIYTEIACCGIRTDSISFI